MSTSEKKELDCVQRLIACRNDPEPEAHREADSALCDFLTALGYAHIVALWDNIGKWYE